MSAPLPSPLPPSLLTATGGGYYDGLPGVLNLKIVDHTGTTEFNIAKSVVWDITNFPTQLSVDRTCTAKTFSFTIHAGKTYHVHTVCSQQPSPYEAKADLIEDSGEALMLVNVLNQEPGLVITA